MGHYLRGPRASTAFPAEALPLSPESAPAAPRRRPVRSPCRAGPAGWAPCSPHAAASARDRQSASRRAPAGRLRGDACERLGVRSEAPTVWAPSCLHPTRRAPESGGGSGSGSAHWPVFPENMTLTPAEFSMVKVPGEASPRFSSDL